MIQLNLLPDVKKELINARRQRNLIMSICIFSSIAAGVVVLILGGVLGGQALQKNSLTDSIKESESAIKKKQADSQLNEYLTIQNQLSRIDALKKDQLIYSRFLDYLKQINPATPNNASLTSVKITAPGADTAATSTNVTLELQGTTSNYSTLGIFETTLALTKFSFAEGKDAPVQTKLLFPSVKTTASSLSRTNKVDFTILVECDKSALGSGSTGIKLEIPNETTSDADRNTPKNVFDTDTSETTTTNLTTTNSTATGGTQ